MWKLTRSELLYHKWLVITFFIVFPFMMLFLSGILFSGQEGKARQELMDVNNLRLWVSDNGIIARNLSYNPSWGLEYPSRSGKMIMGASGLWMGGKTDEKIHTVVAAYQTEYSPGRLEPTAPNEQAETMFKIDPADKTDNLLLQKWQKALNIQEPEFNDIIKFGDQVIWTVFNDAQSDMHTVAAGSSRPMNVEVEQTTFAYNREGVLDNTIFVKFRIKNLGKFELHDMWFSLWSDPDVGLAVDDLTGYDETLRMAYAYNASKNDKIYSIPPAVGIIFLEAKNVTTGETALPNSSAQYTIGLDPRSSERTYCLMQGLSQNGDPTYNPKTGLVSPHFYTGNPVTDEGWLDSQPGDHRIMLNIGPTVFSPGDVQELVFAYIVMTGKDNLDSVTKLKQAGSEIKLHYQEGFAHVSSLPKTNHEIGQEARTLGMEKVWVIVIFFFIILNIIIAHNSQEKRELMQISLPVSTYKIAFARLSILFIPTFVFLAIIVLVFPLINLFSMINILFLTNIIFVILQIYLIIILMTDVFNTYLAEHKREMIFGLGVILVGLNLVGVVFMYLFQQKGPKVRIIHTIFSFIDNTLSTIIDSFNITQWSYVLTISLILFSLLSILTFVNRKSYVK